MKANFSLALIAAAFLLGAVTGSIIAMTVADGGELTTFFGDMVEGARDGVLRNSFWRVLLPNLLWPGLILLFSFRRSDLWVYRHVSLPKVFLYHIPCRLYSGHLGLMAYGWR